MLWKVSDPVVWKEYITSSAGTRISYNHELVDHQRRARYNITGDHSEKSFNLVINELDQSDAGRYECQKMGRYEYYFQVEVVQIGNSPILIDTFFNITLNVQNMLHNQIT